MCITEQVIAFFKLFCYYFSDGQVVEIRLLPGSKNAICRISLPDMVSNAKKYEIAYLLSPSIPEEEVLTYTGKVTAAIEEAKGAIRRMEEPKRRKLAYHVKKQETAYFGWTTFSVAPEAIKTLEKKMKDVEGVLRHVIIHEEEMRTPIVTLREMRREPTGAKPPVPALPMEDVSLDLAALDKKLDEILGK